MKCKEPPSQEEAVKICKKNLRYEITERIIGSDIRTFDRLNNAVAEIEMFLADRPNAVTSSSSGKPKFVDKKNNTKRSIASTWVPSWMARRHNRWCAGDSSSSNNKGEKKRWKTLEDKMQRRLRLPQARDKTRKIFEFAKEKGLIKLPEPKRPNEVGKTDDPDYCCYHRMLGHPTEDCFLLKNVIEGLIKEGRLSYV